MSKRLLILAAVLLAGSQIMAVQVDTNRLKRIQQRFGTPQAVDVYRTDALPAELLVDESLTQPAEEEPQQRSQLTQQQALRARPAAPQRQEKSESANWLADALTELEQTRAEAQAQADAEAEAEALAGELRSRKRYDAFGRPVKELTEEEKDQIRNTGYSRTFDSMGMSTNLLPLLRSDRENALTLRRYGTGTPKESAPDLLQQKEDEEENLPGWQKTAQQRKEEEQDRRGVFTPFQDKKQEQATATYQPFDFREKPQDRSPLFPGLEREQQTRSRSVSELLTEVLPGPTTGSTAKKSELPKPTPTEKFRQLRRLPALDENEAFGEDYFPRVKTDVWE